MDQEQQPRENAFAKAIAYLNFKAGAKWAAHLSAAGTGLVVVALLAVLWLFADLMVWRGRVPDYFDLSPLQQERFTAAWNEMDDKEAIRLATAAGLGKEAARVNATEFAKLPAEERDVLWQARVRDILAERVNDEAVARVFPDEAAPRRMSREDHGVLSLAVREIASGRTWSPVPWLAAWNRGWMWQAAPSREAPLANLLTGLALLTVILGLLGTILVMLNREMAARATIEATTRLRRAVYHHTFRLGTLAVRALGPSEAVSILTRHVEALHDALYARLTVYFREPITLTCLLLFAFLLHPLLSFAFLLFALIVWVLGVRVATYFRRRSRLATNVAAERLTIIRESLMLMRLVKCFLMEQFNQARIERQLARYAAVQQIRHRSDAMPLPLLLLLGGACALVLLAVGGLLVLYGNLSAASAVVLSATLLSLYRPAERWLEARRLIKRGRESAEQVFGFLERRGDVGQVVGAEFLPPLSRQLEFDNVSLRDGGARPLLDGVSLSIPAGQRVALIGAEDVEKHALIYLIPRLLDPTTGEVRIDQHNLRWVTLDSLRMQIGLVMMHNLVFHDTVRNNIGCGDQSYTLPQIIEAAKIAHAHHFIQKLPQGYETPIGELGHQLSLSEQYRIALARAILRDPALLIIEEPDAELDTETKDLLDDTLARLLPGRTAIFLPHRISTLRACNTIHLLSKGKIIASGTHKDLLATNKLYRHLHYLEFNQFDEQV